MDAYFDSAIIVKLYVQEATSPDAIRLVGDYPPPYTLTQWQALEVKNAIRLKAFRWMTRSVGETSGSHGQIVTAIWETGVHRFVAHRFGGLFEREANSARRLLIIHVAGITPPPLTCTMACAAHPWTRRNRASRPRSDF